MHILVCGTFPNFYREKGAVLGKIFDKVQNKIGGLLFHNGREYEKLKTTVVTDCLNLFTPNFVGVG